LLDDFNWSRLPLSFLLEDLFSATFYSSSSIVVFALTNCNLTSWYAFVSSFEVVQTYSWSCFVSSLFYIFSKVSWILTFLNAFDRLFVDPYCWSSFNCSLACSISLIRILEDTWQSSFSCNSPLFTLFAFTSWALTSSNALVRFSDEPCCFSWCYSRTLLDALDYSSLSKSFLFEDIFSAPFFLSSSIVLFALTSCNLTSWHAFVSRLFVDPYYWSRSNCSLTC